MAAGLESLGWLLGEVGWLEMCEFCTICPNQGNSCANLVPSTRMCLSVPLSRSLSRSLSFLFLCLCLCLCLFSVSRFLLYSFSLFLSSSPFLFFCFVSSLFLTLSLYHVAFLCFSLRLLIRSIILCYLLSRAVQLFSLMLCCLLLGSLVHYYVSCCVPALSFRFRSMILYYM